MTLIGQPVTLIGRTFRDSEKGSLSSRFAVSIAETDRGQIAKEYRCAIWDLSKDAADSEA